MYKILKRCRVVLSLLVLVGIASFFTFVRAETAVFFAPLIRLQFVPSLLAFFSGSFVIFSLLLLFTLLFGRIYCSVLCPMGIVQDISIKVSNFFKSKKQKRFRFSQHQSIIRYSLLLIVSAFWVAGITLPILAFDPYSNFGRISNHLFKPVVVWINNCFSYLAPDTFYYMTISSLHFWMYALLGVIIFTIIGFSAFRGRLLCNTICPVGAFLGLISNYSAFRIKIDKNKCTHCRLCGTKCKAECIDTQIGMVDHSRCVVCLNCTLACTQEAMSYTFCWTKGNGKGITKEATTNDAQITNKYDDNKQNGSKSINNSKNVTRRAFLASSGGIFGATALYRFAGGKLLVNATTKNPIAPPGAISYSHLKEYCTACQACVSICPSRIIHPSFSNYGLDGFMLPYLDYRQGFCRYDCNLCSQVCPSKALKPSTIEEKKVIKTGKARFNPKYCVVLQEHTDCGACDEHCPTKAVHMVPRGSKGLRIPKVDEEFCIGCGGCEYICPATPKAIVVEALSVHGVALPPIIEKQKVIEVSDFGF